MFIKTKKEINCNKQISFIIYIYIQKIYKIIILYKYQKRDKKKYFLNIFYLLLFYISYYYYNYNNNYINYYYINYNYS